MMKKFNKNNVKKVGKDLLQMIEELLGLYLIGVGLTVAGIAYGIDALFKASKKFTKIIIKMILMI